MSRELVTKSHTEQRAILMLRAGMPLPVDLTAALVAQGIDAAALEQRYRA